MRSIRTESASFIDKAEDSVAKAEENVSLARAAWRKFRRDRTAQFGAVIFFLLLIPALYAPVIANSRPLLMWGPDGMSLPFLRSFFAPDVSERWLESGFNFVSLLLPLILLLRALWLRKKRLLLLTTGAAVLLMLPFLLTASRMERTNYRKLAAGSGSRIVFAVIPFGPNERSGEPYAPPSAEHWLGCDDVGRDVGVRLIYGARVSLAVGLCATALSLAIGSAVGLATGFFRGWFDLLVMRLTEILLCFPTFLLLLILMSLLGDRKFSQSVPVVIAVLGLTGWIGLAFLVRGEVLKQSQMTYIQSAIVSGLPVRNILFRHLLPNVLPPILVSFTFGVAGAILAESGLSFLGFGVQPPTASWGNLLRQAFDNPLDYWHLTLFPGAALFIAVITFHFLGEGLRHAFTPRQER